MTPVTITKTALTFTRSGPQMKAQLNAIGIHPTGVIFHGNGDKPHYESNWLQVRDTQDVPVTVIQTAQVYADFMRDKISNINVLVCHNERAVWRMGSPVLWASVHFMIKDKETTE